jgi:hypothetical protein
MMKDSYFFSLITLSFFLLSFSGSGYEAAMRNNIAAMEKAQDHTALVAIANKFDRIGAAEKDEWLPYYYAAYCYVMMTAHEKDVAKWDAYLDTADDKISKSENLGGKKVETLALRGFASMMRINVDPAVRGQEYSMKAVGFLRQAQQLDDQNPRVLLMLAQMQYGTAQFFGSGTEEACEMFNKSIKLFDLEAQEEQGILPSWGRPNAIAMLKNCEG